MATYSGIADYTAELLPLLLDHYAIDVFHDQSTVDRTRLPSSCGVFHVGELLGRHRESPYALSVYQLGNSTEHAFMYEPLARLPGLLVLHDLVLHHARARWFLDAPEVRAYREDPASAARRDAARSRIDSYRAEVAYVYPAQADRLVDVQLGTVGDLLPYAYPLFRIPVEASRVTAVHNAFMAERVRDEVADARVETIPMGMKRLSTSAASIHAVRARHGLADALVVGSFGLITREKRIETLARAVARVAVTRPDVRLLLVGTVAEEPAVRRLLEKVGVAERTVIAGRAPHDELAAYIEAVDIAVHLRYPTARETSAALLRLLAHGRATIMSDLEQWAEVPDAAVVRVAMDDEEGEVTRAILRLADLPATRTRIGDRAAAFVDDVHGPRRCSEAYVQVMETAMSAAPPRPRAWPVHWPVYESSRTRRKP